MAERTGNEGASLGDPVRDQLALIRTVLANERTFLAYLRTSLSFIVAGIAAIHFLKAPVAIGLGSLFVLLGILCLGVGIMRFRRAGREIGTWDTQKRP
jgi:putative membrane protein